MTLPFLLASGSAQARARITNITVHRQPAEELPEGLTLPKLVQGLAFIYPEKIASRPHPPQGKVRLKFLVDVGGRVQEVTITQGIDPTLDAVVAQAATKMQYEPAKFRDQAVEVVLAFEVDVTPPPPSITENVEPGGSSPAAVMGIERINGQVLEAGQGLPIAGATVTVIPAGDLKLGRLKGHLSPLNTSPAWLISGETDGDGRFSLRDVPNGKLRIIVQALGFERLDYVVQLARGDTLQFRYFQKPLARHPFQTTVAIQRDQDLEMTRHRLTREELATLPGTQGDALRSLQNLPGMARAPFGVGLLVIRGARPSDSRAVIAEHGVENLFHFGGLTSIVNSDLLEHVEFFPGNFDVRFGDAIGGIVNVVPRRGRRDGFHGYVDVDLMDAGAVLEGLLGKGSFIVSGRRSYIDGILKAVVPDDAPVNMIRAPRYYDYQAFVDQPLGRWQLSIRGFGSDDRTEIVFARENDEEQDARNSLAQRTGFHRVDLELRREAENWSLLASSSYRLLAVELAAIGQVDVDVKSHSISGRLEFSHRLGRRSRWILGAQALGGWLFQDIKAPLPTQVGGGVEGGPRRTQTEQQFLFTALYTSVKLGIGQRLSLVPGVRLTYYSFPRPQFATDPRLRAALKLTKSTIVKAGFGRFSQLPNGQQLDPVFGNPRLGLEASLHTSAGVLQKFPGNFSLEVTGFHRHLFDMVATSNQLIRNTKQPGQPGIAPELYNNSGVGRAYGLELLLRKTLTRNLFGWVAYTLMLSEIRDHQQAKFAIAPQDQTHNLAVVASYRLPKRWQVGLRFRLSSGLPTTPITDGIFDASSGNHIAVRGPENTDRVPMFHQLDLRVDKQWLYKRLGVTVYLDIQNVYNARNVETLSYDFDFRSSQAITGLPIIPSLGIKVEI